jgi:hypothetical protein
MRLSSLTAGQGYRPEGSENLGALTAKPNLGAAVSGARSEHGEDAGSDVCD